jgi:hypothetical protein
MLFRKEEDDMCVAPDIEERVDRLEAIFGQFMVHTDTMLNRMERDTRLLKQEMKEFKNETERDRKAMNKKWGELANKMGTLVEDIISPAIRPVVTKYFDCEITYFSVNVKKKDKRLNLQGEFDVIAVSDEYVFLVEAKSTPKKQYLYEFIANIELFRKLFPEYGDKRLIPVFASLRFEENMTELATQEKIYLLAYREWEYMDFLNFDKLAQVSEDQT